MISKLNKTYSAHWVLITLLSIYALPCFSQLYFSENIDASRYYLSLNSELGLTSDGLTNHFASAFYKGQFLDHSIKTATLEHLNTGDNLLAYFFNTDLYVNIPDKKHNINYYAGFEHHDLIEAGFSKNFFQLFFFGNKDFTGQNLALGDLTFSRMNFQQIKAGISKTWQKDDAKYTLIAGLGFNNGQSLMKYEIRHGSLFTQEDAEYINLDMNIGMKRSDTLNSKFGAENGWGFSADLAYVYQDENNILQCQLEDIGFIRWKKNSQSYEKDTAIYFDGFELTNLLDISGETIDGISADSLINTFAFSKTQSGFAEMIPLKINISYKRYLCQRWLSLSLSLNSYVFSVYRPQLRFVPSLNIPIKNSIISIAPFAEVGGYSKVNCGLGMSLMVNKKFYIELQTAYVNSYLRPKKSAGVGGFISIIKTF